MNCTGTLTFDRSRRRASSEIAYGIQWHALRYGTHEMSLHTKRNYIQYSYFLFCFVVFRCVHFLFVSPGTTTDSNQSTTEREARIFKCRMVGWFISRCRSFKRLGSVFYDIDGGVFCQRCHSTYAERTICQKCRFMWGPGHRVNALHNAHGCRMTSSGMATNFKAAYASLNYPSFQRKSP